MSGTHHTRLENVNYDDTAPTVSISAAGDGTLGIGETSVLTITLSENSSDFALGDITVTTLGGVDNFANTTQKDYSALYTPPLANTGGSATLQIEAGEFMVTAGNGDSTSTPLTKHTLSLIHISEPTRPY